MPAAERDGPGGPPFRFYGRRQGKALSARQSRLIEDRLPELAPDPAELPGRRVWLEIGSGGGEHLIGQAAANPETLFVGCEPFIEGVAKTVAAVEDRAMANVRLHADDARPFLEGLPAACIDRTFVLFPDPWPKLRHHKRRFIQRDNLDRLARVMKPGARLRIATDHMAYARWILWHATAHPDFEWTAARADDWRMAPADHVPTRYEGKARRKGDRPVWFEFARRA